MALKTLWSKEALLGLEKVLKYFEENWSNKEILKLEGSIINVTSYLTVNPYMFPASKNILNFEKPWLIKIIT